MSPEAVGDLVERVVATAFRTFGTQVTDPIKNVVNRLGNIENRLTQIELGISKRERVEDAKERGVMGKNMDVDDIVLAWQLLGIPKPAWNRLLDKVEPAAEAERLKRLAATPALLNMDSKKFLDVYALHVVLQNTIKGVAGDGTMTVVAEKGSPKLYPTHVLALLLEHTTRVYTVPSAAHDNADITVPTILFQDGRHAQRDIISFNSQGNRAIIRANIENTIESEDFNNAFDGLMVRYVHDKRKIPKEKFGEVKHGSFVNVKINKKPPGQRSEWTQPPGPRREWTGYSDSRGDGSQGSANGGKRPKY